MRKFYRDSNYLILDGGFSEQRCYSRMADRNYDGACPTFVTLCGLELHTTGMWVRFIHTQGTTANTV